ncbi:hypothetical protein VP01_907g1 [Puccinia sorghi]|uniref:Glycoside hydrolase family 5 domain-containing protein n=1 Tax=Puccinia sorghi TaxID=27349 RepID=A0A0L6U7M1_9BASI|nr:hypothetical protein VP01_907g1 [Puccinia sorghi]
MWMWKTMGEGDSAICCRDSHPAFRPVAHLRSLLSLSVRWGCIAGNEYEVRDLLETVAGFGSPVTRTYTLQVAKNLFKDGKSSHSHVIGWDSAANDWVYNETVWKQMDNVLALSREYGVKLIIPLINQDYGTSDTDYVGNYNDVCESTKRQKKEKWK